MLFFLVAHYHPLLLFWKNARAYSPKLRRVISGVLQEGLRKARRARNTSFPCFLHDNHKSKHQIEKKRKKD